MTLIAAFSVDTTPVFLSDGLLSSLEEKENIYIPSIGKIPPNIHVLGNMHVHGTTQKTEVISPNLIVAWAGCYTSAMRVLETIRKFALDVTDDPTWIEEQVRANNCDDLKHVSLIVAGKNTRHGYSWSNACQEIQAPAMRIWAQGSGIKRLKIALQDLDFEKLSTVPSPTSGVCAALAVAAGFLGEEMRQLTTLQSGFGGFYEITTFDRGIAKRIEDIVYLFWKIQQTPNKVIISPPFRAMKTLTLPGGETGIYTVDIQMTGQGVGKRVNETYNTYSMSAGKEASERRNENLQSLWQVNVMIVEMQNGSCEVHTGVTCQPDTLIHPVQFLGPTVKFDTVKIAASLQSLFKK